MRGYFARRRRRIRLGVLLISLLCLSAVLVSCVAGSGALGLSSWFGADLSRYQSEEVTANLPCEGELAASLSPAIQMLCTDSVHLSEFQSTSKAVKLYRDNILNSLLRNNSGTYVGNRSLGDSIQKSYPQLSASVLIPDSDFENAVLLYLGTTAVSNHDSAHFSYLSKSDCYTTPSHGRAMTVALTVTLLQETDSTYRMQFHLSDAEGNQVPYQALFVKRSDGSAYLRTLSKC